jgi:opacity protein-like surface antigen
MKNNLLLQLAISFIMLVSSAQGQDDLLSMMEKNETPTIDYTMATFKSTHIVIGQSIETAPAGNLNFLITHHFGALNTGYEQLFGLKQVNLRLALEYGVTKWLGIAVGLNSDRNAWDGSAKVKLFRQCKGAKQFPFTIDLYGNSAIYTTKWVDTSITNYFSSRLTYAMQLMIARKFGNNVSIQITPSYVHKNLVPTSADKNDIFTLGAGGRVKISQRVSINAEYHYLFSGQVVSTKAYSSFSIGVDIETGGHVFQVFLTNSSGVYEQTMLTETRGKWSNGDIFLGFNISRMFTIVKPKLPKE